MTYSRYNASQKISKNPPYGNNNIEKYLREEIDFLLAPSANQLNEVDFNDIYIPMPSAEKFLSSVLHHSKADKILYLTGLTGSGKSMILKKVFQCHNMSPQIQNNTLIIPFSFDGFYNGTDSSVLKIDKSIEETFQNMLDCACQHIEDAFDDIKRVQGNEEEFLKFVKNTRGDYVQIPDTWPRPTVNERMKYFMSKNPIPFHTSMLKFYLNQENCPLNNIVILIDDVEGVGENSELIPIKIAYKILTCLENTPKNKKWSSHLVIGCRNYVYRLIIENNETIEHQQIETYPESERFHIEDGPTISDVVTKRYTAISNKEKSVKWKTALDIVLELISGIDTAIGDFILNLKIRNMRKALSVTKRIVFNKQWIQRDYIDDTSGAFTIDSVKDYNITQATLMRAIGMGESLFYHSDISDIPNVMYNENERNLYPLLILKYCLKNKVNKYATWNDSIKLSYLYDSIQQIFGQDSPHFYKFKESAEYLILKRLLLRSIDQLQDNAMPVNVNNVSKIMDVYISNAAVDIWDYLGKNSVIFEMYTDDIWMDNSQRSTAKKRFRGFDLDNYSAALDYLEVLVDKEITIRNHAQNLGNLESYELLFGDDWVCDHLMKGLTNSLKAFYKEEAAEQPSMERIQALQKKIQEATA